METLEYMGLKIPLDDLKVWDYLCAAEGMKGIFQLETRSAGTVLKKIKPRNIADLSIVNALNRPGAAQSTNIVAAIKSGDKKPELLHPDLGPILQDSYSEFIYQESLMKCAQKFAGFSPKDSATLLKAIGKKKMDKMKSLRENFLSGCVKNGYQEKFANDLFDRLQAFANYGFNASHSVGYSLLSYITAYIKVTRPTKFLCALLNFSEYEPKPMDELFEIASECGQFGVLLDKPTLQSKNPRFSVLNDRVQFPYARVRNVGPVIFEKISTLSDTQLQSTDSLMEALMTGGVNRRSVEMLIISGAMDAYGEREDLLLYLWFIHELTDRALVHFWQFMGGQTFSAELVRQFIDHKTIKTLKSGKQKEKSLFSNEKNRQSVIEKLAKIKERCDTFKANRPLCRYVWENFALGYPLTSIPNGRIKFEHIDDHEAAISCGYVVEIHEKTTKKTNKPYAIFTLKFDRLSTYFCFAETWESIRGTVAEGDFVAVELTRNDYGHTITKFENLKNDIRQYEFYRVSAKQSMGGSGQDSNQQEASSQ